MKKLPFRLDSVLTLRKFRKSEAANRLSAMVRRRIEMERRMMLCHNQMDEAENDVRHSMRDPVKVQKMLILQEALKGRRKELENLRQSLEDLKRRETEAREKVKAAQMEHEAILKMEARHREKTRKAGEKEDEFALEEFVRARRAMEKG